MSARLRVLMSYMRPLCVTRRVRMQQKADVHENVNIRF
ncbi:hypothetical protein SBD_2650 [Streptomyces bottropensis ATCC 25435]|uniref:Uncharacterized protein n=1 Tax=Streptomyces bottropensis ATCC 25435 TaxID=1054862 RepID=M3DFA2_9ACTN|nr:hypothetical protein SBD_2650 [Streptomyces bottropensis ATCC 25435]